jgi:secreted trypsin-like serine protease
MLRTSVFLVLLAITAATAARISMPGCGQRPILTENQRIVNGQNATEGDWPWMVSLSTKRGQHFCGGTLINNEFIVTANHCFLRIKKDNIVVHIGHHNNVEKDEWSVNRTVSKLYKNQQFSSFNARNDIALIKLNKPVKFDDKYIIPACLDEDLSSTDEVPDGRSAWVTGWGDQAFQENNLPTFLKEVEVNVMTTKRCKQIWGPNIDSLKQICANDLSDYDGPCLGDSGGPLVSESPVTPGTWYLHGLVSFGMECRWSTVYTRVKAYLPWMYKTMGLE